jgi:hypothetical protein
VRQYAPDRKIARTTVIKVIRRVIIADTFSFRVPVNEFRKRDFGVTRLDTARKLLDEVLCLQVEGAASMQVIPAGDDCEVRLRAK